MHMLLGIPLQKVVEQVAVVIVGLVEMDHHPDISRGLVHVPDVVRLPYFKETPEVGPFFVFRHLLFFFVHVHSAELFFDFIF